MILDSSAVVALVMAEPGHEALLGRIASSAPVGIGAPTLVELTIVCSQRLRLDARGLLSRFLEEANVTVIPFGQVHWAVAVEAWRRFGKGRHPADLNFGDCLAYATARVAGRPLLCTGGDFAQTDLELA